MTSTARSYFEGMYRRDDDPWGFASSPYERRKYALTFASLPRQHYDAIFEPGCSIGILSEQLADRCGRLWATEIIPTALEQAQARLKRFPHVTCGPHAIPQDWPEGQFDLIVFSEIADHFDLTALREILALTLASLRPQGHLIGVHWRGVTDYPLSGDEVHAEINATDGLTSIVHHLEEEFVLQVWERSS